MQDYSRSDVLSGEQFIQGVNLCHFYEILILSRPYEKGKRMYFNPASSDPWRLCLILHESGSLA